jgi:formamidopyrimidine-DNA glycosylase
MPELPEVETMVRGIRPHVADREIVDLIRPRCTRRPIAITPAFRTLRARCVGRTVTAVERLAKRIVIRLSSGDVLAIEPRMTGLMLVSGPPSTEHLRLEWRLSGATGVNSLWFWDRRGLGTVRLYRAEEFSRHLGTAGGDAPGDAARLAARVREQTANQVARSIKARGRHRLYASEILHLARIAPQTPARELSSAQVRRLHAATTEVLETAIRFEGSTLGDGTYRNALNQAGGYQNAHRVYAKTGERCPRCRRGVIERIVQSQRSTFFCPHCQR